MTQITRYNIIICIWLTENGLYNILNFYYVSTVNKKYFSGNVALIIADVSVNLNTRQTGVLANQHLLYFVVCTFFHTK